MKKLIILSVLTLVMLFTQSANAAGGFISYGGEEIVQVIDLPDSEEYQLPSGEYLDIGYIYKTVTILFIPVWNYDGRLVGVVGQSDQYLSLSYAEMSDVLAAAGEEYPNGPYLDFWHRIGGKLVFLVALILLAMKLVKKLKKNKRDNAFLSALPTGRERLKDILTNGQQFEQFDLANLGLSTLDEEDKTKIEGLEFFAVRSYLTSLISVSVINMNKTSLEQLQATNDEFFERLLSLKKIVSSKANNVANYVYFTFDKSPSDDDVTLIKGLKKRKIRSATHFIPAIIDFEKQEVILAHGWGAIPSQKTLEACFIQADINDATDENNTPPQA